MYVYDMHVTTLMTCPYITVFFRIQAKLVINATSFHRVSLTESMKNIPQCLHKHNDNMHTYSSNTLCRYIGLDVLYVKRKMQL